MFFDREDAGRKLARALGELPRNALILGIPRGGVIVARATADELQLSLDVLVVRKLGAPHNPELAVGAIGPNGAITLDKDVLRALPNVTDDYLEREAAEQLREIQRRLKIYRGEEPFPEVRDRTVVVVDDGIATGSTARAALRWLRGQGAKPVALAVPVAPEAAANEFESEADRIVILASPQRFLAVGQWYDNFDQVSDEEVVAALRERRAS
ncbi:MAG TPA: phosphoribosyltransferase family protein [Actinomycetota bacterium]|nr:phosphoribosyltransferase family protein [Actinomycetota bacterium]